MSQDEYLNAAHDIRADPEFPVELMPKLDELLAAAEDAGEDERADAVDEIVVTLRSTEWGRERLNMILADRERGAGSFLDGVLAGEDDGESELLEFTCTTCQYVNRLPYRPAEDDMPPCQNPDGDAHDLALD